MLANVYVTSIFFDQSLNKTSDLLCLKGRISAQQKTKNHSSWLGEMGWAPLGKAAPCLLPIFLSHSAGAVKPHPMMHIRIYKALFQGNDFWRQNTGKERELCLEKEAQTRS